MHKNSRADSFPISIEWTAHPKPSNLNSKTSHSIHSLLATFAILRLKLVSGVRHQIASYISFLRKSTNQHGVHSPFVYQLVTQVLYDTSHYPAYHLLDSHRAALLGDHAKITVTDYGAGSRIFGSQQREVARIARHAGISKKRQRLLFRLVRHLKPTTILELGTSVGLATAALATAAPKATIATVEGCANTAKVAEDAFKRFNLQNIDLHTMVFDDFLTSEISANIDLAFIDGNHSKEATLRYFEQLLPHCQNDTVLIFDDIHWSKSMTEAWTRIARHERVSVSIDTFQWGLVFFRKEQQKEHFTIRV
jgi:predicted O-methyltransferase YrrM